MLEQQQTCTCLRWRSPEALKRGYCTQCGLSFRLPDAPDFDDTCGDALLRRLRDKASDPQPPTKGPDDH